MAHLCVTAHRLRNTAVNNQVGSESDFVRRVIGQNLSVQDSLINLMGGCQRVGTVEAALCDHFGTDQK
jgi:hypothetical protein